MCPTKPTKPDVSNQTWALVDVPYQTKLTEPDQPNQNYQTKPDMRFVKNFTQPDFQAQNFTPVISPNFNSFSDENTKNEW